MKSIKWWSCLCLTSGIGLTASGCCSILHEGDYGTAGGGGKYRWGCHLVGNLVFGGLIGMIVDLATGAHLEPGLYGDGEHLEDGDSRKLLAVHVSDGTVFILKDVHEPNNAEELSAVHRLPDGVEVVRTQWVMKNG